MQRTARSSTNAVYILIALGRVFSKVNTCTDNSVSLLCEEAFTAIEFKHNCEDKENTDNFRQTNFALVRHVYPCVCPYSCNSFCFHILFSPLCSQLFTCLTGSNTRGTSSSHSKRRQYFTSQSGHINIMVIWFTPLFPRLVQPRVCMTLPRNL